MLGTIVKTLKKPVVLVSILALLLGGCGALSSLGTASRESAALDARAQRLEARSDELERKLELLDETLKAYGPLAEDLGPGIKRGYDSLQEQYGKVRDYISEGRELLNEARSLHERSLEQATDPETGDTDWLEYALLMLAGGGGLYSERRRTVKEHTRQGERVHGRIDKRKAENENLKAEVESLKRRMDANGSAA